MMNAGNIAALIATMVVLAIAPGPSDFAVVARSVAFGFKLSYAYMADRAAAFLENTRARRSLNVAAGWGLIATGLFLLIRR